MPQPQLPVPALPLAQQRVGLVVGATVWGLIAMVVTEIASRHACHTIRASIFFTLFYGAFTWWFARGRRLEQRLNLVHVAGYEVSNLGGASRAIVRGLSTASVLAVAEGLIVGCFAVFGLEQVGYLLPGILLGSALSGSLDLRDLRVWQEGSGLVVFTRVGARSITLTRVQAGEQLVTVADRQC